jgi:ABC-2 type transport system ATP-binding protein
VQARAFDVSFLPMQPLLQIDNLVVRYGSFLALKGVTFQIPHGNIGLLGPNGAGKSTMLKTILGLIQPDSGTGKVLELDIQKDRVPLRDKLGYMPEGDGHFPNEVAIEAVAYAGSLSGLPRRDALGRAHEVLYYVGLEESRYRQVSDFSTGMRQRVKLAQALVHDPELLLLDEPTSGMDPKGRDEMLQLIKTVGEKRAATGQKPPMSVLLSTHLLPDVEEVCEYVIMVQAGQVTYAGTLKELVNADKNTVKVRVKERQAEFAQLLRGAEFAVETSADSLLVASPAAKVEEVIQKIWGIARRENFQIRELSQRKFSLEEAFFERAKGA